MTSLESFLTNAPITPREVRRRYSNGRDLLVVFKKGYRNSGMCAVHDLSSVLVTTNKLEKTKTLTSEE